ncbi:MAG TPA: hypothetical protein VJ932_11585 [Alkalispirochaeta sp.]|nr:hypothetical protein [Alkalispirochaeta sp.]
MKRTRISIVGLLKVLVVVAVTLALAACSPGGDSPQDLVRSFVSAIDSENYSSIQSYLDSGAERYNTANTANYWTTYFPTAGAPYSINSLSGDGPVTAVIAFGGNGSTGTYEFTFSGSEGNLFNDSDYKIRTITTGSTTVFE